MTPKEIVEVLERHRLWLADDDAGRRANLVGADLSGANLSEASLSGANLSEAGLSRANLSEANLSRANLTRANLSRANLSEANLAEANFIKADLYEANLIEANLAKAKFLRANLTKANLTKANLSRTNLSRANLVEANLTEAYLSKADLTEANLSRANLSRADLSKTTLTEANLSGTVGVLSPTQWLAEFPTDELGVIVWKRLGGTEFPPPLEWQLVKGAFLAEVANPDRGTECGCGVNFGTKEWCRWFAPDTALWMCRIHWVDLAGVVVPFRTGGKARCERLELVELIEEGETK